MRSCTYPGASILAASASESASCSPAADALLPCTPRRQLSALTLHPAWLCVLGLTSSHILISSFEGGVAWNLRCWSPTLLLPGMAACQFLHDGRGMPAAGVLLVCHLVPSSPGCTS